MTADNKDLVVNFANALTAEINNVDEHLLPLLREYLKSVREVRMALSAEVTDMVRTSAHFKDIAKLTPQLVEFVQTVERLKALLTPDTVAVLRAVLKLEGDNGRTT